MKSKLKLMAFKNIKELKEAVISMWDTNTTYDYFIRLSVSMPGRMQLCWTARGYEQIQIFLLQAFLNFGTFVKINCFVNKKIT